MVPVIASSVLWIKEFFDELVPEVVKLNIRPVYLNFYLDILTSTKAIHSEALLSTQRCKFTTIYLVKSFSGKSFF